MLKRGECSSALPAASLAPLLPSLGKNKTKNHFSPTLRQRVPCGLCVGALGLRYQPQRAGKSPALFSWIVASGVVSQRTPAFLILAALCPRWLALPQRGSFCLPPLRPCHFATGTGLHCADSRLSVIFLALLFDSAAICATRVQPVPV